MRACLLDHRALLPRLAIRNLSIFGTITNNEEKTMPIDSVSDNLSSVTTTEEDGPTATLGRLSTNASDEPPLSPVEQLPDDQRARLTAQYDSLYGTGTDATIQETPINQALRGTPVENPEKVNASSLLHANLLETPDPLPPKGRLGQMADSVKGKATQLASSATSSLSRINNSGPRQQKISPEAADAQRRSQAVNSRERERDNMQDGDDLLTRRAVRGVRDQSKGKIEPRMRTVE
jgi:hypothetical protein